jgi:quinol monooxygenase YgiN
MIVVAAVVKTVEGKGAEFEREFIKFAPKVRSDPGVITYVLNRDVREPERYLFYEKYEDDEAFKYHTSTEHFKKFFQDMGPNMVGSPEVSVYQEVE